MKTIIKYIRYVIFLNCISLLNLSADSWMLRFDNKFFTTEQRNIHVFLCRQAVFKDCKDTMNRFSVAISFVFKNGARKTFLIKAPGGKSYFESGSLRIAKKYWYKEQLGDIIRDKKIGNYIDRRLRNNEYPEQEKYRLGDSEVSFLYAINKVANFQMDCIQSLAEKITHELARIELHGFTTRDMCPCCYSYMDCFLEQSNDNLKSEKTNNITPENKRKGAENDNNDVFEHKSISKQSDNGDKNGNANLINSNGFRNFFKCLLDQESIKKYLPKNKQIPINFFISSLVELSGEAYKYSVYQGYENEEEKLSDANEIDTENGNNLYCILLRLKDMEISPKLKKGTTSFSPKNIGIKQDDCFALNMKDNEPRYLGNWKNFEEHKTELQECREAEEWLFGTYCKHLKEGIRWSRISPDGKSVKPLISPNMEDLKKLKGSDLVSEDGFLFDPATENFSFDKAGNREGGFNDWYYCQYNGTKDNKDVKCGWWHISWDHNLEPLPDTSTEKAWKFRQAKAMYNANHIFESVKEKRHGLNKEFSEHLKNFPESISDKNKEKQIYKIESGCAKVKWYEELKRFLKSRDNKQPISGKEFSLPGNQSKKFFAERLDAKELKAFLRGFKPSGAILKRMQKYCEDGNESITKLSSLFEKPTKDFLVVFDKYDFGENASPAIFEGKGDVDLEDSDEYNSLFLYYDGEKYYKITPKTESQDAKKDVKKGNSKENSKDPFKISSSGNNSLKEKTEK